MCVEDSSGGSTYPKWSRQRYQYRLAMRLVELGLQESDTGMGAKDLESSLHKRGMDEQFDLALANCERKT